MRSMKESWRRIRSLGRRQAMESGLDEEIRFHVDQQTEKNLRAGMCLEEARRQALLKFGGIEHVKESARDEFRPALLEDSVRDVRYGVRGLLRTPLFTCTVALMLGGGLGVLGATFTLFNAYALRPFAIAEPGNVYDFTWASQRSRRHVFTWREFQEFQNGNQVFVDVYAARPTQVVLNGRSLSGQLVTGNYFAVLGVPAFLGRTLRPDDSSAVGQQAIVVLSHNAWMRRFGSDGAVIGRTIDLAGRRYEIVGVGAPDFEGIRDYPADFWAPLSTAPSQIAAGQGQALEPSNALEISGRLRSDVTTTQARAALDVWAQRMTRDLPERERSTRILLESRATRLPLTPRIVAFFTLLLIVVGLILAVASTNVANLMLVRSAARQKEFAVRISLGAGRARLVRQLLTESVLLSIPAAIVGIAITLAMTRQLPRLAAATLPNGAVTAMRQLFIPLPVDFNVIAFMLLATAATAGMFGVAPALRGTRVTANAMSRTRSSLRLHRSLVAFQIAACVLFVAGAAGLLSAAQQAAQRDPGLDVDHVIDVRVAPALLSRVVDHLRSHAAVERVALTSRAPLYGPLDSLVVDAGNQHMRAGYNIVSPDYFDVFRIGLATGRIFSQSEADRTARVAIVSEGTARRLWPDGQVIGETLRLTLDNDRSGGAEPFHDSRVTIVGVVGDVMSGLLIDGKDRLVIYLPAKARDDGGQAILVRTRGLASSALPSIEAIVRGEVGDTTRRLTPMRDVLEFQSWPLKAFGAAMGALAGFALLLAVSGCYAAVSYTVGQRMQEFGIRAALGATPRQLLSSAVRQPMQIAFIGVPAGLLAAGALSRAVASAVDVAPEFGFPAFVLGAAAGMAAAAAGSYTPSRRAMRLDPAATLRAE